MRDLRAHLGDPEVRALLALSVYPAPGRLERAVEAYQRDPDRALLGLEDGGALVGCIGVEVASGTILNIGVREGARGRGFGRALVEGAASALGLTHLRAETDGEAVGFYRRCGFTVTPLGERYPGVERFACVLERGRPR